MTDEKHPETFDLQIQLQELFDRAIELTCGDALKSIPGVYVVRPYTHWRSDGDFEFTGSVDIFRRHLAAKEKSLHIAAAALRVKDQSQSMPASEEERREIPREGRGATTMGDEHSPSNSNSELESTKSTSTTNSTATRTTAADADAGAGAGAGADTGKGTKGKGKPAPGYGRRKRLTWHPIKCTVVSDMGLSRAFEYKDPEALAAAVLRTLEEDSALQGKTYGKGGLLASAFVSTGVGKSATKGSIVVTTKRHLDWHMVHGRLPCPECGAFKKGRRGLRMHQIIEHGTENEEASLGSLRAEQQQMVRFAADQATIQVRECYSIEYRILHIYIGIHQLRLNHPIFRSYNT